VLKTVLQELQGTTAAIQQHGKDYVWPETRNDKRSMNAVMQKASRPACNMATPKSTSTARDNPATAKLPHNTKLRATAQTSKKSFRLHT
jgi:hypothetical protein